MRNLLATAVVAVATFVASSSAAAHPRCGTPARIPTFRPVPDRAPVARAAGGDKLERDPFGPHQARTSANFAVRWHDATVTDPQAQVVLDELEAAWTLYTGAFGQTPPFGTDSYKLNVYLSTATDSPSIDFGGGYAGQDDDGFPYVVLSTDLFTTGDDWLEDTAAHELYHDFQMSLGGFRGTTSMWWWEATADWAAQQALPDQATAYLFDGAFALAEELAMFFYGDPFGSDTVIGLHQYGASILPTYFTETLGDRSLVVESWEQAAPGDDALDAFFAQFAADSRAVADRFGEFAAHTARWDIPHAAEILVGVNQFAAGYPDHPRLDLSVPADGTDWTTVRAGGELHAWGYNLIELARPADGTLAIDVAPDTAAVSVEWRATLVRELGDGALTYTPITLATGAIGHATAMLTADEPRAWVVVAAIADTRNDRTTFPYRVRVNRVDPQPEPEPEPEPDDPGGCSTTTTGSAPGIVVVCVAAMFAARRRRSAR